LHENYKEYVDFRLVYIREAHPVEGEMPPWEQHMLCIEDPVTFDERVATAQRCTAELGLDKIPLLVDAMDNELALAYEAWPDRLYLIGLDGKVAWRCGPGPFGFDPDGFEAAIIKELDEIDATRNTPARQAIREMAGAFGQWWRSLNPA
jgi:hypothetical protein